MEIVYSAFSDFALITWASWIAGVLIRVASFVAGALNRPSSFARSTSRLGRSAKAISDASSRRWLLR